MTSFRKVLQIFSYYVVPIVSFLILYAGIFSRKFVYDFSVVIGDVAIILFALIVFVKPFSVFFPKVKVLRKIVFLRRELGLLVFWLAFWHSIYLLIDLDVFNYSGLIVASDVTAQLFWGLLGFVTMFILGITSNKLSMIKLKKNWKPVQLLTYPCFVFVCVHTSMAKGGPLGYVVAGVYVLFKIAEYVVVRQRKKIN